MHVHLHARETRHQKQTTSFIIFRTRYLPVGFPEIRVFSLEIRWETPFHLLVLEEPQYPAGCSGLSQ